MNANRTTLPAVVGALFLFTVVASAAEPGTQPAWTEWPQWRGPSRDGVAPSSPKLLDAWPKDGPKLLWKSDMIPSISENDPHLVADSGSGSPIVADGKVFLFVDWKRQVGKWLITTQMLKAFGWEEGVPDDLAKTIESARLSDKRKNLSGAALDAYIKEFMAGVEPDVATKFGAHITLRLTQGREALSWGLDLVHLAKARDKEFATYNELVGAVDNVLQLGEEGYSNPNHGSDELFPLFVNSFLRKKYLRFTDTIICLDGGTGKELWKKEFPGEFPETICASHFWGGSSTPAVAGDRIYAAGSAGLYCLSVKDGAVVWQVKAALGHSSPLVADGRVYLYEGGPELGFKFGAADILTAFSAADGKVLWRQPKVGKTNGSVVQWTHQGRNYLISGAPGGPYCVDPATGDVLWAPPAGAPRVPGMWACDNTPVVSGDIVVLYSEPKMAFKMTPQKAVLLWKIPGGDHDASPLIYQDHAYFFGGSGSYCVELKTGEIRWKVGGFAQTTSPFVADGKLFYLPSHGIGMFRASYEKFEELGRFPAGISPCSSPAIAGGKLYVRMTDHVACYDLTQNGPYLDKTVVTADEVTFAFKQAEGGLVVKDSPEGQIKGLTITDASGLEKPAKATIVGSDVVVDIKDAVPPMDIHSAWSNNVRTKGGGTPVPEVQWKSLRMTLRRCADNILTVAFNRRVEQEFWKTDKAYAVAGMKITNVELSPGRMTARLTLDKPLKIGETGSVKYPWLAGESITGPLAELKFVALPGRPVGEGLVQEFLIGGTKPNIVAKTVINEDVVDKNIKPAAGDKWKLVESTWQTPAGEVGSFGLNECVGGYGSVTHACVYVYSDSDRKVQLWAGVVSDSAIKLIVNGKVVHINPDPIGRPFQPDTEKVKDVPLVKGWNTVLMAIANKAGWWNFSLRIRDEQGSVPSGLSYTAEKPQMGD